MYIDFKKKLKEILTENVGDINEQDEDGNTLLHHAAKNDMIRVIWKLNRKNANFQITNFVGDTPLHVACKNHNVYSAEEIFRQTSKKNMKNLEGKTPLDYLTKTERNSFLIFEDRFIGSGKYEYKPRPEPEHHFGSNKRVDPLILIIN
jgi:ankyrin repeat protein